MEKPYLLFHGGKYYPRGGWKDLKGRYATAEEAFDASEVLLDGGSGDDWCHVIDARTGEAVSGTEIDLWLLNRNAAALAAPPATDPCREER